VVPNPFNAWKRLSLVHPATPEKGPLAPLNLRLDLCTYLICSFVESGHSVAGKLAGPWGENTQSLYGKCEAESL
jgi:hypothetical protein